MQHVTRREQMLAQEEFEEVSSTEMCDRFRHVDFDRRFYREG